MPNWCSNGLELAHKDPAMIERAKAALANGAFFQEFVPCPDELNDGDLTTWSHGPEQEAREKKQAEMVAKYGFKSWYDWNIANWGTKWDCGDSSVEIVDGILKASFETAWSPPVTFYEALVEQGFEVKAYYYEPGMAFVGKWEDGCDDYYEFGGETSATVREAIGEELDDYFGISENMAEWESEENGEF